MGKNRKNRSNRKRNRGTSLAQHRRTGKTLVPPLNRLPGVIQHTRWSDERMPEMLWACLVRNVFPREDALGLFREVAILARELIGSELGPESVTPTHFNLAHRHPQFVERIARLIAKHPLGYIALRPLLLFETLPGKELWKKSINAELQEGDVDTLSDAVVEVLWHQSESSTDIRWLICMSAMLSQKVHLPAGRGEELVEEFRLYPNYGDLRKVRPTIRSFEQSFWGIEKNDFAWSASFWQECHQATPCMLSKPGESEPEPPKPLASEIGPRVVHAIDNLSKHWVNTSCMTSVDAVHEGVFSLVLYALWCLLELVGKARKRIAGRLLLRTIVECRVTLAFLRQENDPALWSKFRRYGSGQAKLAMLKIAEASRPPHSISAEKLEQLANEDVWEEFVDIDLGSWAGIDLRKMAEESGTKDAYDAFYGWTSAFSHGQWAALRDTCLDTCLNALHRLHRIPIARGPTFDDVVPDALDVVEAMIADLLQMFPGATISVRSPQAPSAENTTA